MKNKLSFIAYANVAVVFFIMIFHNQIESVNNFLFYIMLFAYTIVNGIYIHKFTINESVLKKEAFESAHLAELAMSSVPSAIIIVNTNGIIEYVNEATKTILGSKKTIGLNIFDFDTIKDSPIHNLIITAQLGKIATFKKLEYTSFTSRITKTINIISVPIEKDVNANFHKIMLFITDISYETQLLETLDKQYLNMFKSFAKFIDAKDSYTGYHSANVSNYTSMILDNLAIDKSTKDTIIIAANLHDIGKIGVRDDILNKPGKLNAEDLATIQMHPTIGADLLSDIEGYEDIANMIKYHHEWWNGNGYPHQLKREEIPLGSQIISIADAFDAITTDRVYQKKQPFSKGITILREQSNLQFNGDLVEIFIKALNQ